MRKPPGVASPKGHQRHQRSAFLKGRCRWALGMAGRAVPLCPSQERGGGARAKSVRCRDPVNLPLFKAGDARPRSPPLLCRAGAAPGGPRVSHLPHAAVPGRRRPAGPRDGAAVLLAHVPPRLPPRPGGLFLGRQLPLPRLSPLPLLLPEETPGELIAVGKRRHCRGKGRPRPDARRRSGVTRDPACAPRTPCNSAVKANSVFIKRVQIHEFKHVK